MDWGKGQKMLSLSFNKNIVCMLIKELYAWYVVKKTDMWDTDEHYSVEMNVNVSRIDMFLCFWHLLVDVLTTVTSGGII